MRAVLDICGSDPLPPPLLGLFLLLLLAEMWKLELAPQLGLGVEPREPWSIQGARFCGAESGVGIEMHSKDGQRQESTAVRVRHRGHRGVGLFQNSMCRAGCE